MAEAEVVAKPNPAGGSQQQGAGGSRQYGQVPMQPRAKPLKEQTDVELLRGCSIQLQQMMEAGQRTAGIKDPKLKAKFKSNITVQLNATIAEIERRGIDRYKDISSAINSWKMGDYGAAKEFVDARFAEVRKRELEERSFLAKKKPIVSVKQLVPIGVLGLEDYYKTEVKPKQREDVTCGGNDLVISALETASSMKLLPEKANWKDEKFLKTIKADPDKMELVKKIMYLEATTEPVEFATLIAGIKATDVKGANAALQALIDAAKEQPGTLNEYANVASFRQDWHVQSAVKVLGQVNYEDYKNASGKYSVELIDNAAVDKMRGAKVEVDSPVVAECEELKRLVNLQGQDALDFAVTAGVLYSADSRRGVKEEAKKHKISGVADNVAGGVFKAGNKYYALAGSYAFTAGIAADELNVRKEGKKIAKAPLENEVVKNMLCEEIKTKLVGIGVLKEDGSFAEANDAETQQGKAIEAYLKGKGTLAGAREALLEVAELNKKMKVPAAKSIEELYCADQNVFDAISARYNELGNQGMLDMLAALNKNQNCLMGDNVHFSVERTIEEIGKYRPGTAVTVQEQVSDERVEIVSRPEVDIAYLQTTKPGMYALLDKSYGAVFAECKTLMPGKTEADVRGAIGGFVADKEQVNRLNDMTSAKVLAAAIEGHYQAEQLAI